MSRRVTLGESSAWSWVALWLSVIGIGFGLTFTSRTGGPAFQVHLIMGPLALVVLGLLIWTGRGSARPDAKRALIPPSGITRLVGWLMVLAAATLLSASAIHSGLTVPLGPITIYDPFPGARIPEAILGAALLAGSIFVLARWPGAWAAGIGTALFSLLLTIFGLTITLSGGSTGDIAYHIALLGLLVVIVGLLLSKPAMRELPR